MAIGLTDVFKFIDIRKVPAQVWLALAMASAIVLFAPDGLAAQIGVDALRTAHRPYLGGAFVLSAAMLTSRALVFLGGIAKEYARRWRAGRHLAYLTPDQKGVLQRYILEETCTLNLRIDDGVAQGLARLGLIGRVSDLVDLVDGTPYNIQPWLYRVLKAKPELLAGARAPAEEESGW